MKGPSPELAWPPQSQMLISLSTATGHCSTDVTVSVCDSHCLSQCVHMWERTVMGISVHTAETEMATTPTTTICAMICASILYCS